VDRHSCHYIYGARDDHVPIRLHCFEVQQSEESRDNIVRYDLLCMIDDTKGDVRLLKFHMSRKNQIQ
jgi:hypothetical protein